MHSLKENEPLSRHSTFRIGGPARWFVEVQTVDSMVEALLWAKEKALPILLIGRGSNSLFDDQGFSGLAILNRIESITLSEEGRVVAGGGASFAKLGIETSRQGWSGLEFASGIPGTVGGAVVMNAGANGQETADTLVSVDLVTKQGELRTADRSTLSFSYRTSPFQGGNEVVVGATFQLTASAEAAGRQRDLLDRRRKSQPYGDRSAGCIFRNSLPHSAGALIDQCGLKGARIGGALVSEVHGNFIVNSGGATCAEVRELIERIKQKVYQQTGVALEEEVRYVPPQ